MYKYFIYGLVVNCNVEMPLLKEVSTPSCDLEVVARFGDYTIETINGSIVSDFDKHIINLYEYGYYYVFKDMSRIECSAPNYESFFSTLFNMPFSVYFIMKHELLLHASSLINNNKIFCFVGEKGRGKSTFVSILENSNAFALYGDDTLRITKDMRTFRAHNLIKLTKIVARSQDKAEEDLGQNVTEKLYYRIEGEYPNLICDTIISIARSESSQFRIEIIKGILPVKYILSENIIGNSFFNLEILKSVTVLLKEFPTETVTFLKLFVPNGIEILKKKRDELSAALLFKVFLEDESE